MRSMLGVGGQALSAIAILLTPSVPAAQDPQDEQDWISQIIVSAQRREQNILEVPISITTVNDIELDRLGAHRFRDLEFAVPNLTFTGPPSNASPIITLRGISSEVSNAGFESSLSVYVDGVYQGRPTSFNQDLVNVERIEILRGPQGTLFGKNTIAGAVLITNPLPGNETEASVAAEYSRFETFRVNGSVSGPLAGDKLAARLSAFTVQSDGYMRNEFTGENINGENAVGASTHLRFTVGDGAELHLRGDYMRDRREFVFAEQTIANVTAPVIPGSFTTSLDGDLDEDRDIGGVSLTAEIPVGSHSITSVTAWRFADSTNLGDVDGGPVRSLNQTFIDDQWQFSQEVRIASAEGGRLDYLVGLFGYYEEVDTDRTFDVDNNLLVSLGVPPFLQIPAPVFLRGVGKVETMNLALFAHGTYAVTEQLTLIAGLRFNYEEKDLEFEQTSEFPLPILFGFIDFADQDSVSYENLSPTVSLTFSPTEQITAYARFSKGFKGGGWNLGIQSAGTNLGTAESIGFDPEKLTAYEIGLKGAVFDGALFFGLAVFHMAYNDLQVRQFDPDFGISRITNAGKATSQGIEVDFDLRPADGFSLSGGLGYLDATFDEFRNAAGPGVDFDGNRLPNSAKLTAHFAAEVQRPLGNLGDLVGRVEYSYRGNVFFDGSNDPVISERGFGLVNGRIGLTASEGGWEIFLWGKNLAGKDYATTAGPAFFGGLLTNFGLPRTYGIRARLKV